MPPRLQRRLLGHFVMGGALGAITAAALLVSDTALAHVIWLGPSAGFTAAVVAGCIIAYCGIGATLSGFIFVMMEEA